jgi:hypothetical protein
VQVANFKKTIRIVLIHYAANVYEVISGLKSKVQNAILPHDCTGIDALLDAMQGEVDLLIHGHLHRPKPYTYRNTPVLSITTATQMDGYNGFYVLEIFASQLKAHHYKWMGNGFLPDETYEGFFQFSRIEPRPPDPPRQSGPGSLTLP